MRTTFSLLPLHECFSFIGNPIVFKKVSDFTAEVIDTPEPLYDEVLTISAIDRRFSVDAIVDTKPDFTQIERNAQANYQGITNAQLAEQLRRFANGSNVHSDFYFGGRNHDKATGNDRDAMQRIIYGKALPGDKERVLDLANEIERE